MGKTLIKIGPSDHGRRMSLEEFEHAKVQEGYLYELSRGIINVVPTSPTEAHLLLNSSAIRRPVLRTYKFLYPCSNRSIDQRKHGMQR